MASQGSGASGRAPAASPRLALVAAILASTIAAIDATAVNVALPAISRNLGGGFAAQQWVANAYLLMLSALILLAGSLTDRLGERTVFLAGVTGFGVGSLLCALSPSVEVLIAARALQGVSGAMLTPAALAIIVAVFSGHQRAAAIGTWTAWSGIGVLAGPLLGGAIVDAASWRWIFAINVPLVLFAIAVGRIAVPGRTTRSADRANRQARVDWGGAVLAAGSLAGISFGLIEQPVLGWARPGVWGALAAGAGMLVAFVRHEHRSSAPMLPLAMFRSRNFAVANVQTFAMYAGIGLLGFFVTIYLQQVAGYSALESGVTGLVPTLVMFTLSRRMGRLADRLGARPFLTVGPLLVAVGFGLMQRYGTSVSLLADVLPALLVFALGLACTVSPLTATVLADVRDTEAGIASAVNNAIARTAGLVSVAAVGAVVSAHYAGLLQARLADRLPVSAQPALRAAEQRTFGAVDLRRLPAGDRALARRVAARSSEDAFHLAMGIGSGLLVVAALAGGIGLRTTRRGQVAAGECSGGQFAGAPVAAGAARSSTARSPPVSAQLSRRGRRTRPDDAR